jgi:hypothetical protein
MSFSRKHKNRDCNLKKHKRVVVIFRRRRLCAFLAFSALFIVRHKIGRVPASPDPAPRQREGPERHTGQQSREKTATHRIRQKSHELYDVRTRTSTRQLIAINNHQQ